jgi:hypothetical protein
MDFLRSLFSYKTNTSPPMYHEDASHSKNHEIISNIISSIMLSMDKATEEIIIREANFRQEIESQKFFNYVLDHLPIMIWAKNLKGEFIITNSKTRERLLLVNCKEEALGHDGTYFANLARKKNPTIKDYYTFGEVCDNSEKIVFDEQKKGNNGPHIFLEWGNIAGEFVALEVIKAPLYDTENNLIGSIGSGVDVTEKVLLYKDIITSLESSACKGLDSKCNPILTRARNYFKKYHFTGSQSVTV